MAISLTHIVDEAAGEDSVRQLSLLLEHMPAEHVRQRVILIGRKPSVLTLCEGVESIRIGQRMGWPDLKKILLRCQTDIVHAWSADTATAMGSVWYGRSPMMVTISDPADARRCKLWWFHMVNVLCPSKIVQIRLVESGIPVKATRVIRPGVDFSALKQAKNAVSRSNLGLPEKGKVLLTVSPPTRAGGQYYAVWAAAILHNIWPDACLVIPGISKEQRRLLRLIDNIYCPDIYFPTRERYGFAELLAVSDMLIVPALEDIATGWLAWAMAGSVAIVGSAVPAIMEMITDGENGFLCKPGEPHSLAIRIREAAEGRGTLRSCVRTAKNQAGELFQLKRYIDEYCEMVNNLVGGGRLAAG
ncbi:MAG: glycosyltransferase [Planctomycetota bacterium]|nr:MAG: glycosyltransferase [Planctomycetota bacterium]